MVTGSKLASFPLHFTAKENQKREKQNIDYEIELKPREPAQIIFPIEFFKNLIQKYVISNKFNHKC